MKFGCAVMVTLGDYINAPKTMIDRVFVNEDIGKSMDAAAEYVSRQNTYYNKYKQPGQIVEYASGGLTDVQTVE
jgi:hypothetical protein